MFNIRASERYGRVLRRTWYMTADTRAELRCHWVVEELLRSMESGINAARNQPVTEACETGEIAGSG